MIGKTDAASRALVSKAALNAGDKLICAAAIEEQNALPALGNVSFKLRNQHAAEVASVACTKLALHVNDFNCGQSLAVVALGELEKAVFADFGVISRYYVWRGAA